MKLYLACVTLTADPEELSICFLASYLRQYGYDVRIGTISTNKMKHEDIQKEFIDEILEYHPDIVGLSVYTPTKNYCYQIGRSLRMKMPDLVIFLGGRGVTDYAEYILHEAEFADYIIRGEGEETSLELVRYLETGGDVSAIQGISYRVGKNIVSNADRPLIKDLDVLPFPCRDLLEYHKLPFATISTSRGCKANCTFCTSPTFWGCNGRSLWRGRSVKKVVDEMEFIVNKYGVFTFNYLDNSFEDPDYQRPLDIACEILRRNMQIYYIAEFRPSIHRRFGDKEIQLMKHSGLMAAFIGVESGNDDDLALYNKGVCVEDNRKSIELFRRNGINVHIGFINFNAYSTVEKLRLNNNFLQDMKLSCEFHQLGIHSAYSKTGLFIKMQNDGLLLNDGTDNNFSYRFQYPEVEKMARFIRRFFFENNDKYWSVFSFIDGKYRDAIAMWKQRFADVDDKTAKHLVSEYEITIQKFLDDLGERNYHWFNELLDLVVTGWNEERAAEIINQQLEIGHLQTIMARIHKSRFKLIASLESLNKDYVTNIPF